MSRLARVFLATALCLLVVPAVVRGVEEAQKGGVERHGFQAEVQRLMKLIINSLYSNKDIFLRELISNGSDALDKIRFLALTNPELLGTGEDAKLGIWIKADKDAGTVTLRDRGVGMTKAELIENLGTIAHSGTVDFLSKHKSDDASKDLIGQFGVGFYSAFLVADKVAVRSKTSDDVTWVWRSDAGGDFEIGPDDVTGSDRSLGLHGTEITLHLKEGEKARYTDTAVLQDVARKYSEFINFPIYLWAPHEEEFEVPVEEEEAEKENLGPKEDAEEKAEEEETETEEPKTKKEKKTVWQWDVLNSVKPIWTRSAKSVSDEEYDAFYKSISRDEAAPMHRIHFTAEGDNEFRALLYVPSVAPQGLLDASPKGHENNVKLYVRRVFVTGSYEVMPAYLRFIRGVVDSDDMPLNVGRENLQESKLLDSIRQKLVRKSIAMFQELFKNDTDRKGKYAQFWEQYNNAIKYGMIEDDHNRDRLSKLLLFKTSAFTDGNWTTLDEYIARMKPDQRGIYFLAGESYDHVKTSPLIERLVKVGYEVLLMCDPADEWVVQRLSKYEGKDFINVARDGLKLDVFESEDEKETAKKIAKLCEWLKDKLTSRNVVKVVASAKLSTTPAIVSSPMWGMSANMQRIMRSHGVKQEIPGYGDSKVLELNPRHPIVLELEKLVENGEEGRAESAAKAMYWTALISSGFPIDKDATEFQSEVNALLARSLGVEDASVQDRLAEEKAAAKAEEEKLEL